jgi:anti-anti-sigma regulatory factor
MTGSPDPAGGQPDAGDQLTEVVDTRAARISARGRLGLRGARLLAATVDQLGRSGARCVVLDLSQVEGADASALALLASLRRDVAASGARLVLCAVPEPDPPVGVAAASVPVARAAHGEG